MPILSRPSAHLDNAPIHKPTLLAKQKDDGVGHLLGLPQPPQGDVGHEPLVGVPARHVAGHGRRVDRARRHGVDPDALGPQLERHGLGEADDAELGRAVLSEKTQVLAARDLTRCSRSLAYNRESVGRAYARHARHIDDRRAGLEMRDSRPGDIIRPPQVRVDELVKVLVRRLGDGQRRRVDAGAVEDKVEPAKFRHRALHGGLALCARAHVAPEVLGLLRRELARYLHEGALVDVAEHEGCALGRQLDGRGAAGFEVRRQSRDLMRGRTSIYLPYTTGSARDEDGFSSKFARHGDFKTSCGCDLIAFW